MATLLIDTDVLIDHLRGVAQARLFLMDRRGAEDVLCCSTIAHAELCAGLRPEEEAVLRALLRTLTPVAVDEKVAEAAGDYCRRYGKSHGLLLPDAVIAATAKGMRASLVTLNAKHFPMKDIAVLVPYRR